MANSFFITLAIALLGFIATKAQAPFTGRVEYEFVFQEGVPKEQPRMILEYGNRYMKLIPFTIKDSITGLYESETEMVIDYTSGQTYQVIHSAKKIILREKTSNSLLPQMTLLPGQQKTIAGIKANLYQAKVDSFHSYKIWFADSIKVAVNDVVSQNPDFFIFGTGKLLLNVEADTSGDNKKKGEDVTINAVKVTPLALSDSNYRLPTGYDIEDESALKRMQDSLMQQFKEIDNQLRRNNHDDSTLLTTPPKKPATKKPASPKKPVKKPANQKTTTKSDAYRKQ